MKITILEPLAVSEIILNKYINTLESQGNEVVFYNERPTDDKDIVTRARDAEVIVVANLPLSNNVISQLLKLKMISVAFTGFDHIGIDQCKKQGIVVSNSAGYSTESVAELTFGLIISLYRYIVQADQVIRDLKDKTGMLGTELNGKTLGIIGTGTIGTRVAEIGKVFGCKLLGYNRTERESCKDLGMQYLSLDELLANSDIVSIHLPLNSDTQNIINKDNLGMMKSSSILINTSRGGVVNEEDLKNALNEGKVAGAGIDVFEQEPPLSSDNILLAAKNTVFTPHVGYATKESLEKRADIAFANITKWLEGRPQHRVA